MFLGKISQIKVNNLSENKYRKKILTGSICHYGDLLTPKRFWEVYYFTLKKKWFVDFVFPRD